MNFKYFTTNQTKTKKCIALKAHYISVLDDHLLPVLIYWLHSLLIGLEVKVTVEQQFDVPVIKGEAAWRIG